MKGNTGVVDHTDIQVPLLADGTCISVVGRRRDNLEVTALDALSIHLPLLQLVSPASLR
nr:hypothetical protein [Evansella caseinilytica]